MPDLSVEKADILELLSEKTITYDYLTDYPKVERFYSFSPAEVDKALSARRGQTQKADRGKIVETLLNYNSKIGADEAALKNIRLLGEDNVYAVVTGQQPGFLTGPLYTIYKALTALGVCRRLNETRSERFVPIFWSATYDHDIDEVDHTFFVDKGNELSRLNYPFAERFHGGAVGPTPVDGETLAGILTEIEEGTHPTEFRDPILSMVKSAYASTWGEGFAIIMSKIMSKMGLILLDPTSKELQAASVPIFRKEIDEPLVSTDAANRAGDEIESLGYKRQVFKSDDDTDFFLSIDGKRTPISYRDGRFKPHHKDDDRDYSREDLLKWLEERPEDFSPNVLLRPVVQDYLLPTAIYIGGPSEIAYFAQLKGVYEHFHVSMPIVNLRSGATIIEKRIGKITDRFNLKPIDLKDEVEGIFSRVVKESPEFEAISRKVKEDIDKALIPLYDATAHIDQTLVGKLKKITGNILHQLEQVELRLVRAVKDRHEAERDQIENARNNIFPNGAPQERILNILPFLIKYGPDFVSELQEALLDQGPSSFSHPAVPGEAGSHYLVTIK